MTITLGAVFGPGRSFPGTSQALSFGTVTAGQLVTFEIVYWNPVGVDTLVLADIAASGTAVVAGPAIDRQDGIQADTSVWLRTAVFSCVVVTGGTLTLTLQNLQAGSAPTVFGATWNSTAGWSLIPAFRLDGAGAGAATAANGLTAHASGAATSTATSDRNSVHIGVLAWNAGVNSLLTITGGLFSSIGVENDGTNFEPGAASYLIDTTATSADASWSGVMTGAATEGASATQVIYREGQGWNLTGTGPKLVANLGHPMGAGSVEAMLPLGAPPAAGLDAATAETVTLADSQASAATFSTARAETVALTDSQAATATFAAAAAESFTLTDSQGATLSAPRQTAESVALSDSQTATATFAAAAAETVGLADSQSASAQFSASQAEAVALTDAQTGAATFASSSAETVTVTDSQDATVTGGNTFNDSRAEAFTLTDSQSAAAVFVVGAGETVGLADTQTATGVLVRSAAETVTITDAQDAAVVGAFSDQVDESFLLTDEQDAELVSGQRRSGVTRLWRTLEHMPEVIAASVSEGFTLSDEAAADVVAAPAPAAPLPATLLGVIAEAFALADEQGAHIRDATGLSRATPRLLLSRTEESTRRRARIRELEAELAALRQSTTKAES